VASWTSAYARIIVNHFYFSFIMFLKEAFDERVALLCSYLLCVGHVRSDERREYRIDI
jgi:hypothetical protein